MNISQCTDDAMVRSDLFDMLIYVDITLIQQEQVHVKIFLQRGARENFSHTNTFAYRTAETTSTDDGILTLLFNMFFV